MLKKILKKRLPMLSVAALIIGSMLCGCGTADGSYLPSGAVSAASAPDAPAEGPAVYIGDESAPATNLTKTVKERLREAYEAAKNGESGKTGGSGKSSGSGKTSGQESTDSGNVAADAKAMNSASEIVKLAELEAPVELDRDECFVYVGEDSDNPYDVTWDYGEEYQAYVDAVEDADMWDVLFDADFYKDNYPMLALEYHDDDAALLQHFQTVGVHEGRQASRTFNVAAYMENCSKDIKTAFGDHYECYYFYWAMNQKTESKVDTASDGHPLQMMVKLTELQEWELEHVNEYRDEVDVHDVVVDPEFLAFAGFRAQQDFTGDYTGHAWLRSHAEETYEYLELINAYMLGENTVHGPCRENGPTRSAYYLKYRNSPAHYEAMVSDDYFYFGCSNCYWGPDGDDGYKDCQYDLYVDYLSTYMNP